MTDGRSQPALEADRLAERIISRRRWHFWGLVVILAIGVAVAVWQDVATIYIMAGIAAWIAYLINHNFTAIFNELDEINNQIAGRKDEFKALVRGSEKTPVS